MSYTTLYRKWRPQNFNDLIGQQHIVKTLKTQIISNRLSHAYLFCGTRGTGKTSTAKIFAKAVNCINHVDGEPCNKCSVCINVSNNLNIIEIDAASNNGVDSIRELREEVKYLPTEGKYKVYIIDEVHMLSTGAFNALLKTLEEPPSHIIFILATTDPQKIPATILSRCQRYNFKRISVLDMSAKLAYYMQEEEILVEEKALSYISRISDGAMRDALSILDQCISFYYEEEITFEKVLNIVGAVNNEIFYKLTNELIEKNTAKCIKIIDDIIREGKDISPFIEELIIHFRNLLVVKSANTNVLDLSLENINILSQQAQNITEDELMNFIKEFSVLENQIKYSGNKRILLEVLFIKLCNPVKPSNLNLEELLTKINILEQKIADGVTENLIKSQSIQPKKEYKKVKALPEDIKEALNIWENITYNSFITEPSKRTQLSLTEAGYLGDNYYYIICKDNNAMSMLKNKEVIDKLTKSLEEKTGKIFQLKPILKEDFNYKYKSIYGEQYDSNTEDSNLIKDLNIEGVNIISEGNA